MAVFQKSQFPSQPMSTTARMQQFLSLFVWGTTGIVCAWLLYEPAQALAVAGVLWGVHPLMLAVQFEVARRVNAFRVGTACGAFPWRAWWSEVRASAWVFGVWQPWGWQWFPNDVASGVGRPQGVLLVHGFACNRGFWNPWLSVLRKGRRPVAALNLEPVLGSIDRYSAAIDEAVDRLTQAAGQPPLVVAHSMGGLAVRAWLRNTPGALARVAHVVTLGTPHQGTWLARFGYGVNAAEMRLGSDWLVRLAATESPEIATRFTCWVSTDDNIVFPTATAVLPGAQVHQLDGVGHVALATHPRVMAQVMGLLSP